MTKVRLLICVLLAIIVTGCRDDSDDGGVVKTFEIAGYKQECLAPIHSFFWLCIRGRREGQTEWGSLDRTGGLDFEWGYEYTIVVLDTPVENPPADFFGPNRQLLEVTRKEPLASDTEFTLKLRASNPYASDSPYVTRLEDGLYLLYLSTEVECTTPQVCDDLDSVIEEDLKFVATFTFRPELGLPIVLKEIVCTEPNDEFTVQCGETLLVNRSEPGDHLLSSRLRDHDRRQ